jgi:hypothetical protein
MPAVRIGLIAAAALGWSAAPAPGQVTYRASMSPATIQFPEPGPLTYRLEMATGGAPATPTIRFVYPSLGPPGAENLRGSTIFADLPQIEGPGRIVRQVDAARPLLLPDVPRGCEGSLGGTASEVTLALPANSTSTLVLQTIWVVGAPLPGSEFRLGFLPSFQPGAESHPATPPEPPLLTGPVILPEPPFLSGPRGVRLTLLVGPRRRVASARVGQRVVLRGRTDPPVPYRAVMLRYRLGVPSVKSPTERRGGYRVMSGYRADQHGGEYRPPSGVLATVRTDSSGRFASSTVLRRPNVYELTASLVSTPQDLVAPLYALSGTGISPSLPSCPAYVRVRPVRMRHADNPRSR